MKTLKQNASEMYLIASILFYYFSASVLINWFAFTLLAVVLTLILTKHKILGICIGVVYFFINLYMVLALLSELSEFKEFNSDAMQLLGVGSIFIGLNLLFSGLLIYKYTKASIKTVAY